MLKQSYASSLLNAQDGHIIPADNAVFGRVVSVSKIIVLWALWATDLRGVNKNSFFNPLKNSLVFGYGDVSNAYGTPKKCRKQRFCKYKIVLLQKIRSRNRQAAARPACFVTFFSVLLTNVYLAPSRKFSQLAADIHNCLNVTA